MSKNDKNTVHFNLVTIIQQVIQFIIVKILLFRKNIDALSNSWKTTICSLLYHVMCKCIIVYNYKYL